MFPIQNYANKRSLTFFEVDMGKPPHRMKLISSKLVAYYNFPILILCLGSLLLFSRRNLKFETECQNGLEHS